MTRVNRFLVEDVFVDVGRGFDTVADLVEETGLEPAVIMAALQQLEDEDMLERVDEDPDRAPIWTHPRPRVQPYSQPSVTRHWLWTGPGRSEGPLTWEELLIRCSGSAPA